MIPRVVAKTESRRVSARLRAAVVPKKLVPVETRRPCQQLPHGCTNPRDPTSSFRPIHLGMSAGAASCRAKGSRASCLPHSRVSQAQSRAPATRIRTNRRTDGFQPFGVSAVGSPAWPARSASYAASYTRPQSEVNGCDDSVLFVTRSILCPRIVRSSRLSGRRIPGSGGVSQP